MLLVNTQQLNCYQINKKSDPTIPTHKCSVAMPQRVPQSLPNPPCIECLLINSLSLFPNNANIIVPPKEMLLSFSIETFLTNYDVT